MTTDPGFGRRTRRPARRTVFARFCAMGAAGAVALATLLASGCGGDDDGLPIVASIADLAGRDVGVTTGTAHGDMAKDHIPGVKVHSYNDAPSIIENLLAGRVDAFVTDEPLARVFVAMHPGLRQLNDYLLPDAYAFAVRMDNPDLQAAVNCTVARLRASGELEKMVAKWVDGPPDGKRMDPPRSDGASGELRFGTAAISPPFSYVAGKSVVGLEVELARHVADDLGRRLVVSDMKFGGMIPALESGTVDLVGSAMSITEDRLKRVRFSEPHYKGGVAVVVRRPPGDDRIETIADLAGRPIGVLMGSMNDQLAQDRIDHPKMMRFADVSSQIAALNARRIDAFIIDDPIAKMAQRNHANLRIMKEHFAEIVYAMAIRKDNLLLLERVNAALEAVRSEGVLDELDARWISGPADGKVMPPLEFTGENGELRIGVALVVEPFAYTGPDNAPVGHDIELARRIAHRLGLKPVFTDYAFSGLIPALVAGKEDMLISSISRTAERAKQVAFSNPYYEGGVVAALRAPPPPPLPWRERLKDNFETTFIREDRYLILLGGLGVTVLLVVATGVLGTLIGLAVCLLGRARPHWAHVLSEGYIVIFQGTPVLVMLMIMFYIVLGGSGWSALEVAVLCFSMNFAAYVAEILRAGIDSVDRGQVEAARAMGFGPAGVFARIILPQALRYVLPVFKGEYISQLKMTSVAGYIAIHDLTHASDMIRSRTYQAFFPLVTTAILYFLLAFAINRGITLLEHRMDPKRRARAVKGVKA